MYKNKSSFFMRMHNLAMGYEERTVNETSNSGDIIRQANAQFPVPSHIHSAFQDMLRIERQGKLDCFQEQWVDVPNV